MNNKLKSLDPRYYQIAVLSSLLTFGVFALGFGIHGYNAIAILLTAQCVQYAATRWAGLVRFDPLSAVITSLSLTLLLRTDLVLLAILAAAIAIGSKFLLRCQGKLATSFPFLLRRYLCNAGVVGESSIGAVALTSRMRFAAGVTARLKCLSSMACR
jgi:hypothetical protein